MKTNRILMSVAAVALLAASPALAEGSKGASADTNTKINTPVGSVSNSISGTATAPVTGAADRAVQTGTSAAATLNMNDLDTNGDGAVSKDEFASSDTNGIDVQQFAQLDANRDGKLSSAELKANAKVRTTNQ